MASHKQIADAKAGAAKKRQKGAPAIDVSAIKLAGAVIDRAEQQIKRYAESLGLPISSVYITHDGYTRIECPGRLFLGFGGRRNLSSQSGYIGPYLWSALQEAATAYKRRRGAL